METKALKQKILNLAVRGALCPQEAADEPASALLARIRAEKKRLAKEGKIKKEKNPTEIIRGTDGRFYEKANGKETDITDDLPFAIPDSWEWVRLGDIGDWGSGATPSRTNVAYYGGNIPWLKTGDLNDGYIENTSEHITEVAFEESSVRLNPVGSVLIAMYGATIGKLGILKIPATTNQACCACIPYEGIDNGYLFFYLMSQKSAFIRRGEGGAQPNISKQKIVSTWFPLPPLAEQKRIAEKVAALFACVDEWDEAAESLRRDAAAFTAKTLADAVRGALCPQETADEPASALLARIREEKKRLAKEGKIKKEKNPTEIIRGTDGRFYEKVNGKQTDITDDLPFAIPDSWEWVRLGELAYNHGQKKPTEEFCYIDIGSIDNQKQKLSQNETIVSPEKAASRARKIVQKGDILYATVRPYLHNVCIVDKDFSKEPIASTGFAVLTCHAGYLNQFLFYYLLSPAFDSYANASENARGVAYPAINDERLYKAFIPVPPLAEQKRIAARVTRLLSAIEDLKE